MSTKKLSLGIDLQPDGREGFVVDYDRVVGVLSTQRTQFESVGPSPDTHANPDPLRGTPDTGLNGGRPHDGRFSHPR